MDKMYDTRKTDLILRALGLHPSTLRKNNNPAKKRNLDCFRSGITMPFESTFSKQSKRGAVSGTCESADAVFLQKLGA